MAIDMAKLAKVMALMGSPNDGERQAAFSKATAMLKGDGKTWFEISEIPVGSPIVPQPKGGSASYANPSRDFADIMEEEEPGYKARAAAAQAKREQKRAANRAAIIARYGSERAALAPTIMERTVDQAVAPFVRELRNYHYGTPVSAPLAAAVRRALPLPETIAAAQIEYRAWGCEIMS